MAQPEDLQVRAANVRKANPLDSRERPVFVEFAGTPKSGKSTCIEIVSHFFRRARFKVLAPAEGASRRTPYYLKDDWMAFNTWSASYALMHVLEGRYGSDQYDLAILDRGLFDALAWFEFLATREKITNQVRDQVQDFLLIEHWRSVIDAVFLFKTDATTAMERENSDKLIDERGSMMNEDSIAELNAAYEAVRERYASQFKRVEIIDTGNLQGTNQRDTAANVADMILTILEDSSESKEG